MKREWGNFRTGQREYFDDYPPESRFEEFIPQERIAITTYRMALSNPACSFRDAFEYALRTAHSRRFPKGGLACVQE